MAKLVIALVLEAVALMMMVMELAAEGVVVMMVGESM